MNILQFNLECVSILKDININDGLYNYYDDRIQNNCILNSDDELLINYFKENVKKQEKILEIAAGLGQTSHFLNKNKYNNIVINECEIKRYNLCKLLNENLKNNCKNIKDKYQNRIPIGRFLKIEEIYSAFDFLLDERNSYMTGSEITIDGSYTNI